MVSFIANLKTLLFNSVVYLLFLPVVFCLYWFVFRSLRWQNALLLAASYFFYGWWSCAFLCLLAAGTVIDYVFAFGVASPDKSRARFSLWSYVIIKLGILGIFKYYNFFAVQFSHGLEVLGMYTTPRLLNLALPLGISFYTFHGLSYIIDIYKGERKPVINVIDYGVFVSFFPLLVAGPIERANHLLPQVQRRRTFDYTQAADGCKLMLWGFFKKVVIADSLASTVDAIFRNYPDKNAYSLIIGAIAFSFQIYCDFSGYSDIAIGTAKLLGFEVLNNFSFPYFSRNIAEFWRRWHISLTSWFRDYLYIPLGGSRKGMTVALRNVFIVFLVSGFWHGASWNFIAWGFVHACCFTPLLLLGRNRTCATSIVAANRALPSYKELLQMAGTFTFVTLAWVFFRASDMTAAYGYLQRMAVSIVNDPGQFLHLPTYKGVFAYIVPLVAIEWRMRDQSLSFHPILIVVLAVITTLFFLADTGNHLQFIYFQF